MEGPSLVILKEELEPFAGMPVLRVSGNTKQPKESLLGKDLQWVDTWGKTLFLFFGNSKEQIVTKTHFLLFGSYRINDPKKDRVPRLQLDFATGTIYFYACSILFAADEFYDLLDRKVDVLSVEWDESYVLARLNEQPNSTLLCDLFLDQSLFAGSGNIVKNEVLFNLRLHPLTTLGQVKPRDRSKLVRAIRRYCEDFYEWKKRYELRRHWQVYRQSRCPLCERKLVRKNLGRFSRRTFYCPTHQSEHKPPLSLTLHAVLAPKQRPKKEAHLDH